jgi:hyperosmotically inducible periplasmic protein
MEYAMKPARSLTAAVVSTMFAALAACTSSPADRTVGVALEDTAISARVKAALAGDPDVKARDVQVETYRGTVQLSGFVDSPENIRRAVDVARRVDGVREVKNDLLVK